MAEVKEVKKKTAPKKKEVAKVEEKIDAKPSKEEVKAAKAKVEEELEEVKEDKRPKYSEELQKKEAILDKKPVRKADSEYNWGVLHIYSSYNNTHLHVTDVTGTETIARVTGGMVTKSDRLKATPNIAMAAAKMVSEQCHAKGINALYVKLRAVGGHNGPMTPGPGSQAAIRMLTRYGIKLGRIEDVTPIPHDQCRKKGGKRGRRV